MLKNAKDGAVVSSSEHTPSKKFASLFHLRRITTSGSYIPEIDGLRFVVLPAVAFIGLILYIFVERPCMDKSWPAKLYRSIYPSPSPASGPS